MTIDDFYTILMRQAGGFVEQYKKLHEQRPERYPLELPNYDSWEQELDQFPRHHEE
jgi:hypothetical protein